MNEKRVRKLNGFLAIVASAIIIILLPLLANGNKPSSPSRLVGRLPSTLLPYHTIRKSQRSSMWPANTSSPSSHPASSKTPLKSLTRLPTSRTTASYALASSSKGDESYLSAQGLGDPFNWMNLVDPFEQSGGGGGGCSNGQCTRLDREDRKAKSEPSLSKLNSFSSDTSSNDSEIDDAGENFDFSLDMLFPNEKPQRYAKSTISGSRWDKYSIPTSPVIMAPGLGGSRLEARMTDSADPRHICGRKYGWFTVWVNMRLFLKLDCLIEALRLQFDPETETTYDAPGIEVRVEKADKISHIESLHALPVTEFSYFGPLIRKLTDSLNYKRELNIRGAPYDFRKAPNELHGYFAKLRKSIEQMFIKNGHSRVTMVCHSMGCLNMLYFLQRMPQVWKDFYVERLISMAAPWGGSLQAVKATSLGDDWGLPLIFDATKMLRLQRSMPGTIFLYPNKEVFGNIPLIRTQINRDSISRTNSGLSELPLPARNITAEDFKPAFQLTGFSSGLKIWEKTKDLLRGLEPPGVEVWCLVGVGYKTLVRMEFSGEFPYSPKEEIMEDGDKTVSTQSGSACKMWTDKQKQPVYYKEFNADHTGILRETEVLEYIEKILDYDINESLDLG